MSDTNPSLGVEAFASISHELRAPLHAIAGLAELLLTGDISGNDRQLAEAIQRESQALGIIVDDLLDLAQIGSGHMQLVIQPLSPRALIDEAMSMFQALAQAKGLTLTGAVAETVPPAVRGDRYRIRQVLVNLVSNAVKYTSVGSVSMQVTMTDPTHLCFTISDTGPGIPESAHAGLFAPFQQARQSDRTVGSGLGLSICRELVELMNGTLDFDTSASGTTFRVTLPVEATTSVVPTSPAGLTASAQGRILVVDDTEVNRLVALSQLERLGHEAEAVDSGHAALDMLESSPFNLVLMDWHMPVMDGLDTARQYFKRCEASNREPLPLIMMTASVSNEARQTCLNAGMSDFLAKPVSMHSLNECLNRWLAPASPAPSEPSLRDVSGSVERFDPGVIAQMVEDLGGSGPVITVIDTFVADTDSRRSDIHADDRDTAGRAAHTLKSTAALLGATALSEICAQLERLHHEGTSTLPVTTLLQQFDSSLDDALADLRSTRDALSAGNSALTHD